MVPGFDSFSLREAGEKTRVLKVLLRNEKDGKSLPYNFNELSDGQRQLIVLYSLLYGVKGEGYCLFLDEPDRWAQDWDITVHTPVTLGVGLHAGQFQADLVLNARWSETYGTVPFGPAPQTLGTYTGITLGYRF